MHTSSLITLGGFAFSVNGVSAGSPATRKARALMAFLAMNRGVDAARERLLEIFWPDADPDRARDSLSTALHSIRRCIRVTGVDADTFLTATKSVLRWTAETEVDALKFTELAVSQDSAASQEALQTYRGDFLEGDYDNWTVAERERLAGLYETVLARVVKASKDTQAAQRFIARNPYDEEAYTTLIEAELAAGRRSAAVAWVERCRKALSEAGDRPSAEFDARFGDIARVEPLLPDELALPFAGRETELSLLAARFSDVVRGRGIATLVHGEAGIGKSTLLNRAAHVAAENGLRVLLVRCAGELPSTFGPWPEIFNAVGAGDFDAFARSHGSDLATAVAQQITSHLPEPTALIVDDAHELTADALDIFVALAQAAMSKHAAVIGLRPEGVSILRSRLAEVPLEELPIGPLDHNTLKWALAQTLGSEQPDVLDALYQRSGGHPLFFAGLLNSLVDAGALARDGYRWQLAKPIGADIELPETVRRFIETRLRARGDAARSIAGALAIEPGATADDLGSALQMDESTVLDALDDLLALGLITQPSAGTQFAFAHDLIREVAAAGLNAGRRIALHRAFAQSLKASGELEASLRRARHLQAAGEWLAAAQSYLAAAQEALEVNAAQDVINRCDAGIEAAEKLQRTADCAMLLARLHRTAARAALAAGDAHEAVRRAREAVTLAPSGNDNRESILGLVDLAAIEGAVSNNIEQKANADAAVVNARSCGDDALETQAFIQQAIAARELGLKDEALQASQSAHHLALRCSRDDLTAASLEQLLRTQLAWWLFSDALDTARKGIDAARRVDPFAEATFLQARCTLWYLLERFDEAQSELQAALQISKAAAVRRKEAMLGPMRPLPYFQFTCHYMAGKIAIAREDWDQALGAAERASALTNVAKLPRRSEILLLLRIDALLQRNQPKDSESAHDIATSLSERNHAQGVLGWSDCVELARARTAARLRLPAAGKQLRVALNALEANAQRSPLEADRAFGRLAAAASEAGEMILAGRAGERCEHYRLRRVAAAGAAWRREDSAV